MNRSPLQEESMEYYLPARRLVGTPAQIVAQIDELIVGLTGLRQLVLLRQPKRAEVPGSTLRLVKGIVGGVLLLCASSWAAPAAGQTLWNAAGAHGAESTGTAPAQASAFQHVTFGVTLEAYYQYNWNQPPDRVLPLRAYDTRGNSFNIQQAALVIDVAPDVVGGRRYGLRADLQFGMATETVQGNPANEPRPEAYRHLWQVYGTYVVPVGPGGLQVDFGKYASMLGYETNYAKDNQAFSRAYLFNFLPFYHSGLRLTLPVGDNVSVLYMLTNGIQQTEDFNDFRSNHVAAVVKAAAPVVWTINFYAGQEQPDGGAPGGPDGFFKVLDTTVTYAPHATLSLALNANYTTNEVNRGDPSLSVQGIAAYARYQLTGAASLGLRYERLDDEGLFSGVDQVLQETTLTAEYKLAEGFLVRAEFRRDWSTNHYFPGRLGDQDLQDHQTTALVGGVWWIGTKQGAW